MFYYNMRTVYSLTSPNPPGVGFNPALIELTISAAFHLAYFFLSIIYNLTVRKVMLENAPRVRLTSLSCSPNCSKES